VGWNARGRDGWMVRLSSVVLCCSVCLRCRLGWAGWARIRRVMVRQFQSNSVTRRDLQGSCTLWPYPELLGA